MTRPIHFLSLLLPLLTIPHRLASQVDSAAAQVEPRKAAAIIRLLEITRADSVILVGLEAGLDSSDAAESGLPPLFYEELVKKARRDIRKLLEMLVPAYDRVFTLEEIEQQIAFYQSPLGRRIAETGPALASAITETSRRWGMMLGAEVMLDLAKQGKIK